MKSQLLDDFKSILQSAQYQRDNRDALVDDPLTNRRVFAWVLFERTVMRNTINAHRAIVRGVCPVPMSHVIRAESNALGHSDYTSKFALYCVELALGEFERNNGVVA